MRARSANKVRTESINCFDFHACMLRSNISEIAHFAFTSCRKSQLLINNFSCIVFYFTSFSVPKYADSMWPVQKGQ